MMPTNASKLMNHKLKCPTSQSKSVSSRPMFTQIANEAIETCVHNLTLQIRAPLRPDSGSPAYDRAFFTDKALCQIVHRLHSDHALPSRNIPLREGARLNPLRILLNLVLDRTGDKELLKSFSQRSERNRPCGIGQFRHVHQQEHLVAHRHRLLLNLEQELMYILWKHSRCDHETELLRGGV